MSAYYADDYISIIYMILLFHCSKDEEIQLKECAGSSMAGILIGRRRRILQRPRS